MKQDTAAALLRSENEELRLQLEEARDAIEAIRSGQVDALVVEGDHGKELFTLRSADHTYRIFIEKMKEGAVTINRHAVIVYHNSSFATMVNQQASELVSRQFEQYVVDADKEKFAALLRIGWKSDIKGELSLIQETGSLPVQLSITTMTMDDGLALSIIVTDLTQQKEILSQLTSNNDQLEVMNEALEMSNHDLQQFASVASHDLQEPLRKIQVFSHLIKEKFGKELSEVPLQYLNKITSSASRMKVLIVDILNFSRLSAKDTQFEKTDLKAMIADLLEDLEMIISEKNARIIVHPMPSIEVNPGQMRQVFQNLISNAIKFSKSDSAPVIEIFCKDNITEFPFEPKTKGPYCHLHLRDNGIGFDDEKYAKSIFNLFEKLHSKDDYEGSGIGLAIAKKIIEKHDGQINVISKPGVGTEFIISLPHHQ